MSTRDPERMTSLLRVLGDFDQIDPADRAAIMDRASSRDAGVASRTASIIERVRHEGDDALRALALEFDRTTLPTIEVPRSRWEAALEALDPGVRRALERAARNIATVHRAFMPQAVSVTP